MFLGDFWGKWKVIPDPFDYKKPEPNDSGKPSSGEGIS